MQLDPTIFRSYDIRGVVGQSLTPESVFVIAKALGSLLRERGENEIVVARDGRLSSPLLAQAMCDGLLATGCDVIDIGMAATPMLYFATHTLTARSGVMMTGSHNPPDYNGIKMVVNRKALAEAEIVALYDRACAEQFVDGAGRYKTYQIFDRYLREVTSNIYLHRPLHIVIDAGNGVAGAFAPRLFRALGCEVEELFCEVDGNFPNHHPDPSQAENLQCLMQAVEEKRADIGIAFDGDGDRLGVVTNQGEIICPDRLLILFAQSVLAELPASSVIYDVKCTHHLGTAILARGGKPIIWKTGHSLIKAKLAETDAILAGEMSGHIFFKDRWYGFDDGLYAAARLLEIVAMQHEECSHLFAEIPNSINTPEMKIAVTDKEKFSLMEQLIACANFVDAEILAIDGLRVNFVDGWGLLRPSNTTPYLVMRFEATNQVILEKIQHLFKLWLLSVKPDLVLPF